jgi:hypothetical protein
LPKDAAADFFPAARSGTGTASLRQRLANRYVGNADLLCEALHRVRPSWVSVKVIDGEEYCQGVLPVPAGLADLALPSVIRF